MHFRHWLAPRAHRRRFLAMGTSITVTLNTRQRGPADAAIREVQQQLIAFGRDAWAWGPGALADFNRRLSAGERATIPPQLLPLFRRAWSIHQATQGRFEPRLAALVRLWGFDDPARTRTTPPDAAEIARLLAALQRAPAYDGGEHYGPAPDLGWDFGALGKGYIVDLVLDRLVALGYEQLSVDAGGHVGLRGLNGDRPWRIGIRDPRAAAEDAPPLVSLDACDEAVVTHADDQRYFEHAGRRYAHLLDAKDGWPVHGLQSLTVVHRDGALADAAGAALFVAGPSGWPALAQELGIRRVLAVLADGSVQVSHELEKTMRVRPGLRVQRLGPP
jgi:thiamine biosynthesis lipoprotein